MEAVTMALNRVVGLPVGLPTPFTKAREQIHGAFDIRGHVADSFWFNAIVITCILGDSVVVGVEVDNSFGDAMDERMGFWLMDLTFATVFTIEMAVRMHQQGWEYFRDTWNIFDYICVSTGATALLQATKAGSASDAVNLRVVKALKGLRVLRLLRIVRHIGGLKFVEGLWLLVSSLLEGVRTLAWVAVFLVIAMYTLAIMLVTMIGDDANLPEHWADADIYVASVGKAMLTVWQVSTLDAWASDIARPIIESAPVGGVVLFLVIFVITFGILNVVLAVMVEHIRNTMENSKRRTARKLDETEQMLMERMAEDFASCDLDKSGELEYTEFVSLLKTEEFAYKLRLIGVQFAEAKELFHLMDADSSGSLSPEEFVCGLRKIKGVASGQDLVHVICFAQRQCGKARKYVERVQRLSERADVLQRRLNTMGAGMTAEITRRQGSDTSIHAVRHQAKTRTALLRDMNILQKTTYPQVHTYESDGNYWDD